MRFKQWLQNETQAVGLKAPRAADYLKTAAYGVGKAVAGAIPFASTAWDVGELANRLWQMRQQGQDVTPLIRQMMDQQDKGGIPANAFDIEDGISGMLSDPSKMQIVKNIVTKIDNLIAQARAGRIPPDAANIEAINYINRTIGPTYKRLRGQRPGN